MAIEISQIPLHITVSILNVYSYCDLLFGIENLCTFYIHYMLNRLLLLLLDQLEITKIFPNTINFNVLFSFLNSNS